jgi:CDP-glucose 4,6-dehydratase
MENMAMNLSFWRNKTILITGHTGFKGSWLSLWLQELGANVIGFALAAPTQPNLFTLAKVKENMISLEGDVRDFDSLLKAFLTYKPDLVFHMAAQSLVRYSYEQPLDTYAVNVMGTVNLFEAVRKTSTVRAIINVTSDKCYENKEWMRSYHENDVLGGHDPYSNSKACAELITSAFRRSFYKDVKSPCGLASARAGNVIGGGDWAKDRLIPDIVRSILHNVSLSVRYPQALRPWQHVLEPLSGYLKLAQGLFLSPDEYAQAWNFGPEESGIKSVDWIIQKIQQLWQRTLSVHYDSAPKLHEASLLKLDSSKAKLNLDWEPIWDLETALKKTIDWYCAWEKGEDLHKKTLKQIEEYMNDVKHSYSLLPPKVS